MFVLHQFNRLSHLCLSPRLRPLRCLPSSPPPPPPFAISRIISLFNCCWLRPPPPPTPLLRFDTIQLPTVSKSSRAAIVGVLNRPNAGLDGHQTRRWNKGAIVDSEINLANPPLFFLCEKTCSCWQPPRRRRFISPPTKRCCREEKNLGAPFSRVQRWN